MKKLISYTSANTIPIKLVANQDLMNSIINHNITPIHIQINPTNSCPLNCTFCSCKNRDKSKEINFNLLKTIINKFSDMGMLACTITGGGDPLAYTYINETVDYLNARGIAMGLVTNGVLFSKIKPSSIAQLTWCRISLSNEYKINEKHLENYITNTNVDWSFSYVISSVNNIEQIIQAINFANKHKFTHVRIVSDILNVDSQEMDDIKYLIKQEGIDDSLVIYQGRKEYKHGNKRCLISLMKPNIDAEGNIIPCCGTQYAEKTPSLNYGNNFRMGNIDDIDGTWNYQEYFNGSICDKCFYSEYNDVLNILWNIKDIKHKNFI